MPDQELTKAITDVMAERLRQKEQEGFTAEHDDEHKENEMALAAACYAFHSAWPILGIPGHWPWHPKWWRPKGQRRDLVKAAALIIAEIERLDRKANNA